MASEKITIYRTSDDGLSAVEQLPKTITTQVYDADNVKFLNETIADLSRVATTNDVGRVKVDGTSITVLPDGTISSVGGGGLTETTANIEYFVNGTSGNDDNDGSQISQFKTINKAISMIPKVVNHNVVIRIADGVYNVGVNLDNFLGKGSLSLTAQSNARKKVFVDSIKCNSNICKISIYYMTQITSSSSNFISLKNVLDANISLCDTDANSNTGITLENTAYCVISSCSINNKVTNGIYANTASNSLVLSTTGTNNGVGIACSNLSKVFKGGNSTITGTVNQTTGNGGQIIT